MRQQYHFRDVNGHKHIWDVNKLIKESKDLEIQRMPLARFDKQIHSDYWSSDRPMTCFDVAKHVKLINESDLSFPILVCSQNIVVDGMHRLCKALIQEIDWVDVIVIDQMPPPDFIDKKPEDLAY